MITVAPTGAELDKSRVPELPVSVEELVTTAQRCEQQGASVVHVHVRDDRTAPTLDPARLRETVVALHEATGLVVQLSTGGAVSDPESARLAVLDAGPDAASLTCGTVNFGDEVFVNRWPFIVELHRRMRDQRIVPEYEIFDLGHLATLRRLLDEHGAPYGGHVHCDLVMGVPGGMPGTVVALVAAVRELPDGASWSATGIGRCTLPVMLSALAAGGHLRVGLEDTVTFAAGERVRDNSQLVERAATLSRLAQRPPLDPPAARQLLGIAARAGPGGPAGSTNPVDDVVGVDVDDAREGQRP